ncbi:GDP-mannose 4,6-dehydratase [bacterium]|nr:GDP-mannose 4,6-dehydratase [bacterium]
MDRVFITGVTGQDGSYLADLLLSEGLEVFGLVRRKADATNWRIRHLDGAEGCHLIDGDLTDLSCLTRLLTEIRPRYLFNLAAQSFVPFSWDAPLATAEVTATGVLNVLEAVRNVDPGIRVYQASSSEMFGKVRETPQTEETPFYPRSPYGVSKCFGHYITVNYRESYGLFAASGILFNHESERRGLAFVTRKVTYAAARIKRGLQDKVALGNLDSARDWGYAPDYVRAMWLMLNQDAPEDYVIATGVNHTVRELCEAAFGALDLDWSKHIEIDERFLRPAEVNTLLGNPAKAKLQLGWEPATGFAQMIAKMAAADLKRVDAGITWEI